MAIFSANSHLIVFRHAEAVKNLEKIHGGGTQDLTVRGKEQIRQSAVELGEWLSNNKGHIFFQTEERSKQTALLLGSYLGAEVSLAEGISGVGLGIIASLDEDELAMRYPDVAAALADWRTGVRGLVNYPKIPGSESMLDFAVRIRGGLSKIVQPGICSILVGTTSVINMVNHLLLNEGQFVREKYDFVTYPLGGFTIWAIDKHAKPTKIFSNFKKPA